ncbi:MAG: NADH-quinone oxidoreductase subunit C [Acidimicrobiia bacterium]
MTSSPSDTEKAEQAEEVEQADHPLQGYADEVATAVGGKSEITFDTVKVKVSAEDWVKVHQTARDQLDLVFFSFLSAIDWAKEVEVGDPLKDEDFEERIEMLTTVSDLSEGRRVTFSADLPTENPVIDSLIDVYAGANWHEREAAEMFGIDFTGHPGLSPLYLPDAFEGNPLRKSFPLLSREVKPWPGKVDVEGMPEEPSDEPSTENPEA